MNMKRRVFSFIGLVMIIAAGGVYAAVLHASWINATTNTDTSVIPTTGPGSIASSELEYGTCNAAGDAIATVAGTVPVTGQATLADSPDLPPGTWCAHVRNVNTYGAKGLWSDVKSKVVATPIPGKPSNFTW
jgi:hypothetical protein